MNRLRRFWCDSGLEQVFSSPWVWGTFLVVNILEAAYVKLTWDDVLFGSLDGFLFCWTLEKRHDRRFRERLEREMRGQLMPPWQRRWVHDQFRSR